MPDSHQRPIALLGITGSIAAYKSVQVVRLLQSRGFDVQIIATAAALRFVGISTFEGLTGRQVVADLFADARSEKHVELAKNARCFLVAPASADSLARLAHGRTSCAVTATALCYAGVLHVAPAMHPSMWAHPATQDNIQQLRNRNVQILGPADGIVASGDSGLGRMLEPDALVAAMLATPHPPDLKEHHVLISSGPTVEDIDPVRFIGNRSSGKMGLALAQAASIRGAKVTVVSGPSGVTFPASCSVVRVRSALEMEAAMHSVYPSATMVVMAAAVGDYRPALASEKKLKRDGDLALSLVENPDIIKGLAERRNRENKSLTRPSLVAFAVETGTDDEILAYAQGKLQRKGVDLVVANRASDAFGRDDNLVVLVSNSPPTRLQRMSKARVADSVFDHLLRNPS